MNLDEIKELIGIMRKNKIREIDLEQEGVKVRIVSMSTGRPSPPEKAAAQPVQASSHAAAHPAESAAPAHRSPSTPAAPGQLTAAPPANAEARPAPVEPEGVAIKSPMVGTFYRAPAPDAPPYVEVGNVINQDTVLCIIEAMKLMNEIKAEMRGKILKTLVENGQPVEFNQPLFLVEAF
jgi:acetyl-CoA carboxylase biotin carboxyl carrier protein